MNRRLFLTTTFAGLAAMPLSAQAQSSDEAVALVRRVSDQLLKLFDSGASTEQKRADFVRLMDDHSDIRQIAGFALGRYGRGMSESLKPRYINAFKRFIAATYVDYFSGFSGATIQVGNARPTRHGYMVDTTMSSDRQAPATVRWDLSNRSGSLLIEDFVVEGISMASSQRGEFVSLIGTYGGDVEKFIEYLEARG